MLSLRLCRPHFHTVFVCISAYSALTLTWLIRVSSWVQIPDDATFSQINTVAVVGFAWWQRIGESSKIIDTNINPLFHLCKQFRNFFSQNSQTNLFPDGSVGKWCMWLSRVFDAHFTIFYREVKIANPFSMVFFNPAFGFTHACGL